MKKLIFILLLPLFLSAQAPLETAYLNDWQYNLDEAFKLAEKSDKNVLVYFTGSDWCPPCKMLKKDLFETIEFTDVSKNYVIIYVDMPRNQNLLTPEQMKHNKGVVATYNKKGVFPLLKILSNKGKTLDEYSGYAMNGGIRHHLRLLRKHE